MTSALQIDGEKDDGFDWEAAVRAIDVACENANNNPSSSSSSHIDFGGKQRSCHNSKQSTLDRFINKVCPGYQRNNTPDNSHDLDRNDVGDGDSGGTCVEIDAEAAKSWIYPVNIPLRDYQFAITKTALFANTLVALPTGLGKTLIAAVVMYNYFRWFPEGKIVFAAPSRPLVMQQIEACHNIVGIPQEWTIDMTGQVTPAKRACYWETKRVFFVTPQVLERDIQAGTCLVKYLVCLVIDEAHRATGNYSYCVAVRELMAVPVHLRILALTATPGSKQQAIQHIIDNLHISTLEYRSESDPDVSPYVHDRKTELIQVPLGKDAVDVNKKLFEVIRPYVTKLSEYELLPRRDYQTLSPPDLLNSRDRFRMKPPPRVPESKYGEIEACFGALITLYHIRKLLSSHGIRPAYEMLEEKLKQGQGPFARLMCRNEEIRRIKLLMKQNLSHGAPSPKLSKMLEILVEHFKTKDPQRSRVIIFSNFRGSVRDILDALVSIGDIVKATEFIGQSSGKVLKGQSQKVQQAVLQKFRDGGYNVIVATSIGEEGLDIMEVDMVICFDANISPLRMIQRMGRTGRNHDGRVVVLACEGSELKGYMRKQANGRNIKKHMHNGGINSFNFHSSSRMIPHVFKPEVKLVKLSIEQYVPRGKKAKDNDAVETPVVKHLTAAETTLLSKYFQSNGACSWRQSLIAFPHAQALPSRVYKVMHSSRTNMLIDMMQQFHGLSSIKSHSCLSVEEDEVFLGAYLEADPIEKGNTNEQDSLASAHSPIIMLEEKVGNFDESPLKSLATRKHVAPNTNGSGPQAHSFLFSSDFVTVDPEGKVIILSVPSIPLKAASHLERAGVNANMLVSSSKQNSSYLKAAGKEELVLQGKDSISAQRNKDAVLPSLKASNSRTPEEDIDHQDEASVAPDLKLNIISGQHCEDGFLNPLGVKVPLALVKESDTLSRDDELSPRLTLLIHSGIVPESPCQNGDSLTGGNRSLAQETGGNKSLAEEPISPENLQTVEQLVLPLLQANEVENVHSSPTNYDVQTPPARVTSLAKTGRFTIISPSEETPLANLTRSNTSRDWIPSSGDKSGNVDQVRKLRRLRKVGDASVPLVGSRRGFSDRNPNGVKNDKRKRVDSIRDFIEEEAEASSDGEASNDEENDQLTSSYDDSFIDDRISPTAATTQGEASRLDMLAVYRRSLLSQSPIVGESSPISVTPDSVHPGSRSPSVKTLNSQKTPQTDSVNRSSGCAFECSATNPDRTVASILSTSTCYSIDGETRNGNKKRKLTCHTVSIPAINLEQQFTLQADAAVQESFQPNNTAKCTMDFDLFPDDQFFASIDFDAVEAQAASLLKQKLESSSGKHSGLVSNGKPQENVDFQGSPSFDLGIW